MRLTGPEVVAMMRKHKVSIRDLATKNHLTIKRVREVRERGVEGVFAEDWVWMVTGNWPVDSCGVLHNLLRTRSVFDGPLYLFDHADINTVEAASKIRTGALKLPGHDPLEVAVEFANFTFNAYQKRNDAVFAVKDENGAICGHYFASAFQSLAAH